MRACVRACVECARVRACARVCCLGGDDVPEAVAAEDQGGGLRAEPDGADGGHRRHEGLQAAVPDGHANVFV